MYSVKQKIGNVLHSGVKYWTPAYISGGGGLLHLQMMTL